ncbi:MAG: SgcJ/EcaC family oxidoreductase [Chthoniobacterales bacterium]
MKKYLAALPLLAALFIPVTARCDTAQDTTAIRDVVATQQSAAWTKHDAKAYAALFKEDGDCVNVLGWWWKSRADIEKKLTDAFAFVFKDSVLTIKESDVDVKFLTPEVALVHARWTMTGAKSPGNAAPVPQQGIQTHTLQKQSGKWLIAAFQNTNSMPEMPFPKGPPGAP